MPKLTKTGELIANSWQILAKDADVNLNELKSGSWLIHINQYLLNQDQLPTNIGVWLDSDDNPESASAVMGKVHAIGVNFPVFSDGRGFSIARTIKQQFHFVGELCAMGNFMQDQLFYLKRCGFDAFLLNDDSNISAQTLNEFSDYYQAAEDQPLPLFRRRSSH
jgi:uncharacterized protein (DUF934 family)